MRAVHFARRALPALPSSCNSTNAPIFKFQKNIRRNMNSMANVSSEYLKIPRWGRGRVAKRWHFERGQSRTFWVKSVFGQEGRPKNVRRGRRFLPKTKAKVGSGPPHRKRFERVQNLPEVESILDQKSCAPRDMYSKILENGEKQGENNVLRISSKFWFWEPILVILGFWYRLQNFEKSLWRVCAHIGTNFGNLTIEFWWNHKVMINHRGGILIFGQILSKLKFWILGLRISNFGF